ncbi:MAG: GDYXXLXY domain-containing protein [Selenomonadales bacterium]|nr:GDYXXLXY domain-containing protein [Selenomonadales bacterium]
MQTTDPQDPSSASSKQTIVQKLTNLSVMQTLTENSILRSKTVLFIALALLQLAVPLYLAGAYNSVLTEGDTYRFALKATEATDIRHGSYAYLNIEEDHGPYRSHMKRGDTVYAILDKSKLGLARVIEVRASVPEGHDYITAEVYDIRGGEAYLTYPFSLYYLDDEDRRHLEVESLKDKMQYTVTVKVKDGKAVAEKLNFNE